LVVAPTDGEAQLLLATLLRRVGRLKESREALDKLSRSDSGGPWLSAIARELERLAAAAKRPPAPATTATADDDETAILPLDRGSPADGLGERAA
jgi:thioredoxin-like negative regulator of GroEL